MATSCETETIIRYKDSESHAELCTSSKSTMRKLDKLCQRFPNTYKHVEQNDVQATYHFPKDRIKFKSPANETERQAARDKDAALRTAGRRVDRTEK